MTVTVPNVPTPVPSRADPTNFAVRADAYHTALPGIVSAMNQQNLENNALNSAVNTTKSEVSAIANIAAQVVGVSAWSVSTSYAMGACAFDPVDYLTYRRTAAGAGGLRPGLAPSTWRLIASFGDVTLSAVQTLTNKTFGDMPIFATGEAGALLYLDGNKKPTSGPQIAYDGSTATVGTNLVASTIANRAHSAGAPGDLFSFPFTENTIGYPGSSYQTTQVVCVADVSGSLRGKYFRLYGPGGTSTSIDTTSAEQAVDIWFSVDGVGTQPSTGAGRYVGVDIALNATAVQVANAIAAQFAFSSDVAFSVGSNSDGTTVFVTKVPYVFTQAVSGTSEFTALTLNLGSGNLPSTLKWTGGVLAPNGKIYGIPYNSTSVLVTNPATNIISTFGNYGNTGKWYGGVLAPNGKIYGIPYNSTSVLVIDPATNNVSTFGSLTGTGKWIGGVLAPNGKIYGIPYNSTSVLVIDPATNNVSTFGSLTEAGKWIGGVLAPNGKIYGIPSGSASILVIDPATNSVSTFGSLTGSAKWYGGVLAPNGKIYGIPYNSTSVLVIDPAANSVSTFGSLTGSAKWYGGVLAPNGKIYGIPYNSTSVLAIDPATNSVSTFGSLTGTGKWIGGVLAPNGKIYGIPSSSTALIEIFASGKVENWMLSAYVNKL